MAFDGYVPVSMLHKFQQFVQMTVAGIPLVQTVQKTVEIPLCSSLAGFFSSRCCATTGAEVRQVLSRGGARYCSSSTVVDIPVVVVQTVHGELPKMHLFDSRRNSSCGAEASLGLQTARKPSTFHGCSFQQFLRDGLITQVISSRELVSVTVVTLPYRCDHTHRTFKARV